VIQTGQEPTAPLPPAFEIPDPVIVQGFGGPEWWQALPPPVFVMVIFAIIAGSVIVLWPLVRAISRRIEGRTEDVELRREIEELRMRVREIEGEQTRFAELEERLDFAERLLAQGRSEAARLQGGGA
jgi:Tfp pilus assembly protein PilO